MWEFTASSPGKDPCGVPRNIVRPNWVTAVCSASWQRRSELWLGTNQQEFLLQGQAFVIEVIFKAITRSWIIITKVEDIRFYSSSRLFVISSPLLFLVSSGIILSLSSLLFSHTDSNLLSVSAYFKVPVFINIILIMAFWTKIFFKKNAYYPSIQTVLCHFYDFINSHN